MTELPDYCPIANATWEEKLSWIEAEAPLYQRVFEAAPWYDRKEQTDWYLESLRELPNSPKIEGN